VEYFTVKWMDLFVTYGTTESVPQGLEWKDHAVLVGEIKKVKRFAVVIEMGRGKGRKLLSGRQQAMPTTGKPSFTSRSRRTAKTRAPQRLFVVRFLSRRMTKVTL
jgi:hypothetical protein